MRARAARAAAGVLLLGLLAGCAAPSRTDSSSTDAGNTVTEIAAADRGEPIVFRGQLDTGDTADSTRWLGSVVVVNFWYASCPPCRAEAPDLEALHKQFGANGVVFVGVNVRDTAATVTAFDQKFGMTYSSILDTTDSTVQLAFAGKIAPNSVPTTIILDREGRAAARILGRIPSRGTLATLITSALAEGSK